MNRISAHMSNQHRRSYTILWVVWKSRKIYDHLAYWPYDRDNIFCIFFLPSILYTLPKMSFSHSRYLDKKSILSICFRDASDCEYRYGTFTDRYAARYLYAMSKGRLILLHLSLFDRDTLYSLYSNYWISFSCYLRTLGSTRRT